MAAASHPRVVALGPTHGDPSIAIAASRAGALGLLNLEFVSDVAHARSSLARLTARGRGHLGALIDAADTAVRACVLDPSLAGLRWVALAAVPGTSRSDHAFVEAVHRADRLAVRTVTSLDQALAAADAGFDALIAKGHESGGWVSAETAFILTQRLRSRVPIPFWVQGGVGERTAAACILGGAAGVVLDSQLLLAREAGADAAARRVLERFDGSETRVLVTDGVQFRVHAPLSARGEAAETLTTKQVKAAVGDRPGGIWPLGQDAAFAAKVARRYVTVGGIVQAFDASMTANIELARRETPLDEGSSLATAHGTRYPIVQGPMTRVSDVAPFALEVARAGALPFLALALMRRPEVEALLTEAQALMGDRPWGVGILGFVPPELRAEQLEAVRAHSPPFALIAGGRADQALELESDGISTYLHVPSPHLLEMFLVEGARQFVFEGLECGGHIGPRTSFVLWESMIDVLLAHLDRDPSARVRVLFAGGIHDSWSAAMASVIAAPLSERGVSVGVLCGTAYLYAREAVSAGAIIPSFQRAALEASTTAVLESAPGLATRCLVSPFVDKFEDERRRLAASGASSEEQRQQLELLNIGRLRIATKGLERGRAGASGPSSMREVDETERWQRGLFMIGQAGAMHDRTYSIAELHGELSAESGRLLRASSPPARDVIRETRAPAAVAIVGMASIVPGASDLDSFWDNILNNVDAVAEVPPARWDIGRYFDPDRAAPDGIYSRSGGFIDEVPFDPLEFGIPPSSIPSIEPFQLLALLVVRDALRDAGYATRPFDRDTASVILGAGGGGGDLANGYVVRSSLPGLIGDQAPELVAALNGALPEWTEDSFPGILMNVAAGRVANRFDLHGVNFTVDAACASSLAAIYLAVRELENGTSDMVVAGGIDAIQSPFGFLSFSRTQALSPTGRSRPFDATADGIAISEGFAALILKRLADAERDGDRVYAVIRGVGGASDGRARGLTAPEPAGQIRALERAYVHAQVSAATVELVEAHGTGTVVGDRAEIETLHRVFEAAGAQPQATAVGSVKSIIGHTKAAAGIAGTIKVAKALHHRVLPPTLGVSEPNPSLGMAGGPVYVNTLARPWVRPADHEPRRAGVSAFGFGGTNFHVVLEEYRGHYMPDRTPALNAWPAEIFTWRAESRSELSAAVRSASQDLVARRGGRLGDLAFARATDAAASRGDVRLALVAASTDDLESRLVKALEVIDAGAPFHGQGIHFSDQPLAPSGKLALIFPGQGTQYVNMLRELAVTFPDVREAFDAADGALVGRLEKPLSRYAFPPPAFTDEETAALAAALTETHVAQPALGAAELALVRLLTRLGIQAELTAGPSYGELVALCLAGAIPERLLLHLSEARGRLMSANASEDGGAMAAVLADQATIGPLLATGDVWVANVNSVRQIVLSGSTDAIENVLKRCAEQDVPARRLAVSRAFHSPLVASAEHDFAQVIAATDFNPPTIPVYSNTTAARYPDDPVAMRGLLAQQLTRPVKWADEIEAMYQDGARVFLEVGPGRAMSNLVRDTLADRRHASFATDVPGQPGVPALLDALGGLYTEGAMVDPVAIFGGRDVRLDRDPATPSATTWMVDGGSARAVTSEPRQPRRPVELVGPSLTGTGHGRPSGDDAVAVIERFQDVMRHFLDVQQSVMEGVFDAARRAEAVPAARAWPAVEAPSTIARHVLRWRPIGGAQPDSTPRAGSHALIVGGGRVAERLGEALAARGMRVTLRAMDEVGDPAGIAGSGLSTLIFLGGIDRRQAGLAAGATELFELVKAVGGELRGGADHAPLVIGATALALASGGTDSDPVHAWLPGFFKSLALEWPEVAVRSVDLPDGSPEQLAQIVLREALSRHGPTEVAYDAEFTRHEPSLEPAPLPPGRDSLRLERISVVLATGGGQGVTAEACVALAQASGCRFVLVGRSPAPVDAEAKATLGIDTEPELKRALRDQIAREGTDPTPARIEQRYQALMRERSVRSTLERLRSAGSEATYLSCDVGDTSAFSRLIDDVYGSHGRIDGVLHGAGVLEDRLLEDQTREQFERVLRPKLNGAAALAAKLRPESLQFMVLLSSVTARAGNRGQIAYGSANEALNRLAGVLARRWQRRVVAINWGPWKEIGMVSDGVRRQFEQNGVALIPTGEGIGHFLDELRRGGLEDTEVIVAGRSADSPDRAAPAATPVGPLLHGRTSVREVADGGVAVDLSLALSHDRYLLDHVIDGRPVLPFTMALELMAEATHVARPGLPPLREISDMRMLHGIALDADERPLSIRVEDAASATGEAGERLLVSIVSADSRQSSAPGRVHYRATLAFGAPAADWAAGGTDFERTLQADGTGPLPMSMPDAYAELLFHGPLLHAMESIEAIGPLGGRAYVLASKPDRVLAGAPPGNWLLDPVALDAALQLQLIWARTRWGMSILPSRARRLIVLDGATPGWRPGERLRCDFSVSPESQMPLLVTDFALYGEDGRPIVRVEGFEAVGSRPLSAVAGAS